MDTHRTPNDAPSYLIRDTEGLTLMDVAEMIDDPSSDRSGDIDLREVKVDLLEDHSIDLAGLATVPVSATGMMTIANALEIPGKFLDRLDADIQQVLIDRLIERLGGVVRAVWNDDGLKEISGLGSVVVQPNQLVDIALRVLHPEADVIDFWVNPSEFRLDVVVSESSDRGGIGGDYEAGDLTKGGIRIIHNRKANTAPQISEFLYRLVCTNGMEVVDASNKVDARGNSVAEVLADLEAVADAAFRRVEDTINSFYDTRRNHVEDPELDILRYAQESGLSARITEAAMGRYSQIRQHDTLFEVINTFTNLANSASVKDGPRMRLQRTGGGLVTEHVERCSSCRSRLV